MSFVVVVPTVELNCSPVAGVLITPYALLSWILPHLMSVRWERSFYVDHREKGYCPGASDSWMSS